MDVDGERDARGTRGRAARGASNTDASDALDILMVGVEARVGLDRLV